MDENKDSSLTREQLGGVGGGAGGRKDWVACCPACGWDMGENRYSGRYYCKNGGCSEYRNGCHTVLPFTDYPADLTPSKLSNLVKKNYKS